jgi:hypothetical protein
VLVPGELPVRNRLAGRGAVGAEGIVAGGAAGDHAVAAGDQHAAAAQVIAVDVEEAVIAAGRGTRDAYRDALVGQVVAAALDDIVTRRNRTYFRRAAVLNDIVSGLIDCRPRVLLFIATGHNHLQHPPTSCR